MSISAQTVLHTEEIRQKNSRSLRSSLFVLLGIFLVACAGIAVSLIWRDNTHLGNTREVPSELITMGISFVFGAIMIFYWDFCVSPHNAYRRFLKEISSGLTRQVEGTFKEMDETCSVRNHLSFYKMIVVSNESQTGDKERVLYWDASLPRPSLYSGQAVCITAHGNDIVTFDAL